MTKLALPPSASEAEKDPDAKFMIPDTVCPSKSKAQVIPLPTPHGINLMNMRLDVQCDTRCPLYDGMESVWIDPKSGERVESGDSVLFNEQPVGVEKKRPVCLMRRSG